MLRVARRFSGGPSSIYTSLLNEEQGFSREQRFMKFCKHMEKLYDMHSEHQAEKIQRDHTFRMTAFTSDKPLRDALTAYAKYRDSWDSEHIAATSQWIGEIAQSRGPRAYFDFTNAELYQSWQFVKYLEDVKFGLKEDIEFPSTHLARVAESLGDMQYNDSELIQMIMNKLKAELAGNVAYTGTEPNHKYHVYTGFVNNASFQEHLQTLYQWKQPKTFVSKGSMIEELLEELIDKVNYMKGIRNDLASSVFNLSGYYYNIKKTIQDEPNLLHNHYLRQAILELEEMLVSSGLISPDEIINLSIIEDIDLRMERAEELFKELVQTSFSYISSPSMKRLYQATEDFGKITLSTDLKPLPNPNAVNGELISRVAYYLSKVMNSRRPDRHEQDYPNNIWKKEAFNTQIFDKQHTEKERIILKPEFTSTWIKGQKYLKELIPDVKARLNSFDINSLCMIAFGYAKASVVDEEMFKEIAQNIFKHLEADDPNVIAKGLYGLNLAGDYTDASLHLSSLLNSHSEVDRLYDSELCQGLWALCNAQLYDSPVFPKLLSNLSRQNITKEFLDENHSILNDIRAALEIEGPGFSSLSQNIQDAFNASRQLEFVPSVLTTYDPLKPLVVPAVRGLMGQEISSEEAKVLHSQLQAKVDPGSLPFKFDDLLVFNGKVIPVFLEGYDGFSHENRVLGNLKMRMRLMKKLGFSPVAVPIYDLVHVSYSNAQMRFRKTNQVVDLFLQAAGSFKNYLEPSNTVVEKFIKHLRKQELKGNKIESEMFSILKQILTLYKLQSITKLTPDYHTFNSSLEDLKIQLLKLKCSFEDLKPANQQLMNLITSKYSSHVTFLGLIKNLNDSILVDTPEPLSKEWIGIRQSVELFESGKKDITPELINQSFLWLENYHHYKDWEILLHNNYPLATDMLIESKPLSNRFFFGARRQQEGILPKSLDYNSLKMSIPAEARLITNLQNIKYELKRSHNDQQILDKILNLEVFDKLIDEHLIHRVTSEAIKLLPRNAQDYVQFRIDQDQVSKNSDPYVNFFKKMHAEKQIQDDVYTKLMSAYNELNDMEGVSAPDRHLAKQRLLERYYNSQKELEKDSVKRDFIWNNLKQELQVRTDESNLFTTAEIDIKEDNDLLHSKNSEEFLRRKRLKAEVNMIKARILYKLHNDSSLSSNESAYLKLWMEDLNRSSLNNAGNTMLKVRLTKLKLADLSEEDIQTFESLYGVSFSSQEKAFSANELIFELSNFIDDATIKNFELRMKENQELLAWGISKDSTSSSKLLPNYRNKELELVNKHIEEYLWRKAGHFTEQEIDRFWNLYKFQIDKSKRGQALLDLDKANFLEFLQEANKHDDRLKFIATWYRQKEADNQTRGYQQSDFQKSDTELQQQNQNSLNQKAMKELEAFTTLKWDDITSEALLEFIRKFRAMVILHEIKEDKLLQLRGILIHPRLPPKDQLELKTLLKHYKIEVINEELDDSLSHREIQLFGDKLEEELTLDNMEQRLKNAKGDYLSSLVNKVENITRV